MSYRKLVVDNKEYEYVIGKKFTKVKLDGNHFALYENSVIGNEIAYVSSGQMRTTGKYVVTPKSVQRAILGKSISLFTTKEGTTNYLMVDPFAAEIYQSTRYIPFSFSDYYTLSDEI